MPRMIGSGLSRREREILEVLHRLNKGTVGDVLAALEEAPSYSAVRTHLRTLEAKGHVMHQEDGRRYVYLAVQPRSYAAQEALQSVLDTFFEGNAERAIQALIVGSETRLPEVEIEQRFEQMMGRVMAIHREQQMEVEQEDQKERIAANLQRLFDLVRDQPDTEAPETEAAPALA